MRLLGVVSFAALGFYLTPAVAKCCNSAGPDPTCGLNCCENGYRGGFVPVKGYYCGKGSYPTYADT
ncbi:hypothetical protein N7499_008629 [Penicillium canescens]|nr:hypothetical protein N7499_008629 [Penicillium canescens]KAJ6158956.1 hypothetical protein N7485_011782 [Penicillium canescens]